MLEIKNPIKQYIYNYCFHMRRTCIVVNPRALAQGKTTFRWLTTWCSPHMKAITVLIYRNYSKIFITNLNVLFCRRQRNNFRYRKYNYGTGLEKNRIVNTLPVVRGSRPEGNLLSLFTLYIFCLPSLANFP